MKDLWLSSIQLWIRSMRRETEGEEKTRARRFVRTSTSGSNHQWEDIRLVAVESSALVERVRMQKQKTRRNSLKVILQILHLETPFVINVHCFTFILLNAHAGVVLVDNCAVPTTIATHTDSLYSSWISQCALIPSAPITTTSQKREYRCTEYFDETHVAEKKHSQSCSAAELST